MRRLARKLWEGSFALAPFPLVRHLIAQELIAPCYHMVSSDPPAHVRHLYPCPTIDAFEQELEILLRHFRPISLSDLHKAVLECDRAPAGYFFLSFDDGFRELYDHIAPICLSKGIPATFFLTTGFLANSSLGFRHKASVLVERCRQLTERQRRELLRVLCDGHDEQCCEPPEIARWLLSLTHAHSDILDRCAALVGVDFAEYLKIVKPYLTHEQVEHLLAQGFTIGAHSVTHPAFASLSLDEQSSEVHCSLAHLHERFVFDINSFALPFTSNGISPEFYRAIFADRSLDLLFSDRVGPGRDGRVIRRISMETSGQPLEVLLRNEARVHARMYFPGG